MKTFIFWVLILTSACGPFMPQQPISSTNYYDIPVSITNEVTNRRVETIYVTNWSQITNWSSNWLQMTNTLNITNEYSNISYVLGLVPPSNITICERHGDRLIIGWKYVSPYYAYEIYIKDVQSGVEILYTNVMGTNRATIGGLQPLQLVLFRVVTKGMSLFSNLAYEASPACYAQSLPLPSTISRCYISLQQSHSLIFGWDAAANATSYNVYNAKGDYLTNVTNCEFALLNCLNKHTLYNYHVEAYNGYPASNRALLQAWTLSW